MSSKCRIETLVTKSISSKVNILPFIAPELTFKEHTLRYALYTPAGVYIKDLENIISDFSVTKNLNGGLNSIEITIKAPIDDYDEYDFVKNPTGAIRYGNRVKVILNDTYNTDKVIFWGYLTDINPNFSNGQERVSLTFYSALSKLSNDYLRTYSDPIDFYYVETAKSTSTIIKDILDNYRNNVSNPMISYTWGTSISDCANVVTYTFDRVKHLDSLKKIQEYLPATWYWYVDALGVVYVKDSSSTTQHKLTLGKNISELSVKKSSAEIVNYFFLWNGRAALDSSYVYEDYADEDSQKLYDKMVLFQDDSEVLASTVADIRGTALITNKKDPQEQWTLTITDDYDIASLEPGHRVSIRNIKSDTQSTVSDDLVIQKISYKVDRAVIEVGAVGHDLTKYTAEEENAVQQSILQAQRATEQLQSGTTPITNANIWYNGAKFIEDDVVYSPVIAGVNGYFKESIRLGDNGVGAVIRSYGKAAFNNGVAGFWLEKSSTEKVYFELYANATNYFRYNSNTGKVEIAGDITLSAGSTITWSQISDASVPNTSNLSSFNNDSGWTSDANLNSLRAGSLSGGTFISNKTIFSPIIAGSSGYFRDVIEVGYSSIGGVIRSYGKTSYADGNAGFFLEKTSGGTINFELYYSSSQYLRYSTSLGLYIRGSLNADDISAGTLSANRIASTSLGASKLDTTIISGGKIITSLLTASNIQTGTLDASLATITNINASNINTGTLSGRTVQSSSGNDRVVLNTGDYLDFYISGTLRGRIRGTSARSGGAKLTQGDMAVSNNYAFLMETTTSNNFARIGCDSSNNILFVLGTANTFYLKSNNEGSNYLTVSSAKVYIGSNYLLLKTLSSNPTTDTGGIWHFSNGVDQFRGEPSAGWNGSFDMSAI